MNTPSSRDTIADRQGSRLRLERKVALYERTLGIAVLPVLIRRLAIAIARTSAPAVGGDRPSDPRRWVDAGPQEIGRFKLFLDPESAGHGASRMALGTYDDTFFEALRPLSGLEGGVIWDVGAHIGYESLCFARLVGPAGRVVAFEPNPANVREWQRNVEGNPDLVSRLAMEQKALGDASGTAAFRFSDDVLSGGSSGSHLASAVPPEEAASYSEFGLAEVACARIDDLVESGVVSPPTVIKIDVEGAEADVLRGAMHTLRRFMPTLLIEVHHVRAMHDVGALLHDAGYRAALLEASDETASRCFLKADPASPEPSGSPS